MHHCFYIITANVNTMKKENDGLILLWQVLGLHRPYGNVAGTPRAHAGLSQGISNSRILKEYGKLKKKKIPVLRPRARPVKSEPLRVGPRHQYVLFKLPSCVYYQQGWEVCIWSQWYLNLFWNLRPFFLVSLFWLFPSSNVLRILFNLFMSYIL